MINKSRDFGIEEFRQIGGEIKLQINQAFLSWKQYDNSVGGIHPLKQSYNFVRPDFFRYCYAAYAVALKKNVKNELHG